MSYSSWTTVPINTNHSYSVSTGTGSTSWATMADGVSNLKPNTLHVKGTAEFEDTVSIEGDLKVQGKSIKDSLDRIEERLAILRPNEELEEKWDQLRGLRQMYMELEAEIIEKEAIWATLKK